MSDMSEPICHCGHVRDEHDESRACTVVGCGCIHYERDWDEVPDDDDEWR